MIPRHAPDQKRNNQLRMERPVRQFTRINMTLSQVLPHLLRSNLVTLKESPKKPNTTSPHYHTNAHCAYHSQSPGHDTNNRWALKNKVQDLLEAKDIEFDTPEKPNAIEEDMFVTSVDELMTPLITIKKNLLIAGVFPGCNESCHFCLSFVENGRSVPSR